MDAKPEMWVCERCGRSFAHRNQTHTCRPLGDVDAHFIGKDPAVREIFDGIVQETSTLGPFEVLAEKTRIAFHRRMSFAAFVPRRSWLDGHVVLAERMDSPRFTRIDEYSPRNIVHAFRLHSPADLDDEVRRWLRLAYAVGNQDHLKRL